jgi:hypothetical protein
MLTEISKSDKIGLGYRGYFARAKEIFLRYSNFKIYQITLIILLSIFIYVSGAHAGWSDEVRISDSISCFRPRIAASESTLHVIYGSVLSLSFYQRSTNLGQSWSAPFYIAQDTEPSSATRPVIRSSGDTVLAIWYHNFLNGHNIGFRKSLDGGESWSNVSFVIPNNWQDFHQSMSFAFSGSHVFVFYALTGQGLDSLIFTSRKSTDLGATWSAPTQICQVLQSDEADLVSRGDTLFLLWSASYSWTSINELYFSKSTDGGNSWSVPLLLSTFDNWGSQGGSIAVNERRDLAVCWMDAKHSPGGWTGDLFIRYSHDLGETFSEEQELTTEHSAAFPRIIWRGDSLHIVWQDGRFDQQDIFHVLSSDNGYSWGPQERVEDDWGVSFNPDVAVTLGTVNVVWDDRRTFWHGTYYSRWTAEPDKVEQDDNSGLSGEVSLSAHPNPFNSLVIISYSNIKMRTHLDIYNVQGQLVKTINLKGEEGKIIWDARDAKGNSISSGIYFAKAEASQSSKSLKLIYLK